MANKQELPDTTQERLQNILANDAEAISEANADFLRARRAYLEPHEQEKFADVLDGDVDTDTGNASDDEDTADEEETEDAEEETDGDAGDLDLDDANQNDLFAEIDRINAERDGDAVLKTGTNSQLKERIQRARDGELTDEDLKS